MLLGMAVLGIILTIAANLLQSNQRVTDSQQARTASLEDARMAASRIAETLNQSAYIFPAGKRIQVTSGLVGRGAPVAIPNEVTTGSGALALLVPDGTNSSPRRYTGVIFYLADRSKFLADLPNLPSNRVAPAVLVEARSSGTIGWDRDTVPDPNWAVGIDEGVLIDGAVDAAAATTSGLASDLMRSASFSPGAGIDQTAFNGGLRANRPLISATDALLLGVSFQLAVRVSPAGQVATNSPTTVIPGLGTARNVPRR